MSGTGRVDREKKTVRVMVRMYCTAHHGTRAALCPECDKLLTYSFGRIDGCVFMKSKPTCAKCPVHCYEPASRERMREVMRHAGPRMLYTHPYLAIAHAIDTTRKPRR
jgi:hypothetical protein